jgi:NAD(P)-dependent dehydrogenase (short-subunit alcohol dehydrogenase family)
MKSELTGQVVLVTGGAVRLGRAMVERLAAEGCGVVIHCHRSRREADQLAADLRARGTAAAVVQGSLTTQTACERIIRTARRAHGRLDILVNSAAVFNRQRLGEITAKSLLTNSGPTVRARAANPGLCRGHPARARHQHPRSPHCRPRHHLHSLSVEQEGAGRLHRSGGPGSGPAHPRERRGPGAHPAPAGKRARYLREHAGRLPLGRAPAVDEVAEAVVALVRSRSITGQILFVDGGQHLLGNGV